MPGPYPIPDQSNEPHRIRFWLSPDRTGEMLMITPDELGAITDDECWGWIHNYMGEKYPAYRKHWESPEMVGESFETVDAD